MWDFVGGGLLYGMAIYSFWNFLDLTYDMFIDIKKKRKEKLIIYWEKYFLFYFY